MVRATEVDKDKVFEACFAIAAEGKSPSFEKVYNAIGRKGGNKVVTDFIAEWFQLLPAMQVRQQLVGDVPPRVADLFNEAAHNAWGIVCEVRDQQLAEVRDALALEKAALEESRKGLQQEMDDLRTGREQALATVRVRDAELEAARQGLAETQERLQAREQQMEVHARALEDAQNSIRQLGVRIDQIQEAQATALAEQRSRHEGEIQSLNARADGDRRRLMQDTDDLRQNLLQSQKDLQDQGRRDRELLEALRVRAGNAETAAAREKARADGAEREVARFAEEVQALIKLTQQLQLLIDRMDASAKVPAEGVIGNPGPEKPA